MEIVARRAPMFSAALAWILLFSCCLDCSMGSMLCSSDSDCPIGLLCMWKHHSKHCCPIQGDCPISTATLRLRSFDSRLLEVEVVSGATYNLLSQREHQLNVMVKQYVADSAHISAVGFKYGTTFNAQLTAVPVYDYLKEEWTAHIVLEVNGVEQRLPFSLLHHQYQGVALTHTRNATSGKEQVHLTTPDRYSFVVTRHDQYLDVTLMLPLDCSPACNHVLHGLLGDTYNGSGVANVPMSSADYQVPDMMSDSFGRNLFNPQSSTLQPLRQQHTEG